MKKFAARTAGAVGAFAASIVLLGGGIANADSPTDNLVGKTYADASKALADSGLKGVIAGRVAGRLPDDQCVVTNAQKASWVKGNNFARVTDTVQLYLNCGAAVASAGTPGNSAATPEGRKAKQEQELEVWKGTTPEGAAWCAQALQLRLGTELLKGCPS
jgi:hypothetical protein